MRILDNVGLNPDDDPSSAIWPATMKEIEARGLTVTNLSHGKIYEGGTAVVVKAREDRSGHIVAIKVYRDPDGVETIDGEQIPIQNYFLNECKSLADLQECAAVPRYHYGVNDENRITGDRIQPFVVMEFVDGMTAEKVGKGLANEADRAERLVELFRKAMVGLQRFHDAGKIHRDISGRNVMLQGDRFRFVDCARAKAIDEVHTGMHTVKGGYTPGYASEELIGERKTPAEDVSELCTVVYEWFTGSNKSESNLPAQWYKRLVAKGSDAAVGQDRC
ncbi:MAG: protein kinase [Pirellulaceae bacterium]